MKLHVFHNLHFVHILASFDFFFPPTDEIHLARQKSRSDADFYQTQKLAEANSLLLTKEYLELKKYEAIAQNNKVYYGTEIPSMFIHGGCGGGPESVSDSIVESAVSAKNLKK
jgi:hypothetical protein